MEEPKIGLFYRLSEKYIEDVMSVRKEYGGYFGEVAKPDDYQQRIVKKISHS